MKTKEAFRLWFNAKVYRVPFDTVIEFLAFLIYYILLVLINKNIVADSDLEWIMKEIK